MGLFFLILRFDAQINLKIVNYEYFKIIIEEYNEKATIS